MTTGGCLCGQVRYRIEGALGDLVYCHCAQCRHGQGVGMAANVPVERDRIEFTDGSGFISGFNASPEKTRYFCRLCGSPLYSHVDGNANFRVRAGTLDGQPVLRPGAHIFVESKAPWLAISDSLPRYPRREPGR